MEKGRKVPVQPEILSQFYYFIINYYYFFFLLSNMWQLLNQIHFYISTFELMFNFLWLRYIRLLDDFFE